MELLEQVEHVFFLPKGAVCDAGRFDISGMALYPETGGLRMNKYKCTICGYIYDPKQGDPDGGIKPGTSFEDIPDTWVCPICGATKDLFVRS